MNYRLFFSVVVAGMLATQAFAGEMTWVGSIAAGPTWASASGVDTLYLTPEVEKAYAVENSTSVLVDGEFFAGIQKTLCPQWLGQLGLAMAATSDAHLSGEIWDDADAVFNNYSYQYAIYNTRVALKGKLLLDKSKLAMPWVSASLGVGFNRAHHLQMRS